MSLLFAILFFASTVVFMTLWRRERDRGWKTALTNDLLRVELENSQDLRLRSDMLT